MMKTSVYAALFAIVGIFAPIHEGKTASNPKTITLYKNPQCGCCEGYAEYMRKNGYTVTVVPTHELSAMSKQAGIPEDFEGCHLSMIDGYVVGGHVPVATVNRLLSERPAIKGITLPGMPMGSPGMNGIKSGPFTIYTVGEDRPSVYATE
ncbi:MAG: DUF411 domain-containing protein [Rhodospirillales bacterium]